MTAAVTAELAPMRLLFVTSRYLPLVGGTEIHTYETARRIAASGHDVTVLTTNPGGMFPAEERLDGVRVRRVPCWSSLGDSYVAPDLMETISDGDWDLVHCQGAHTMVPPMAMFAALKARIPYVVSFHSGGHSSALRNKLRGAQRQFLRPLLARAERLIGVSRFEADLFRKSLRLPHDRVVVIPNGAHLPEAPSTESVTSDGPVIVSVGRLERYKGHHRVVAALPHILEIKPDVRVRVVGSGPFEPELRRLAQRLGVSERVEIGALPASDREGMSSLLAGAALVTLLSEYESHGIAVMEAISLKRPVLVADTSALRDLAERGLARKVAVSSSPRQVASAILDQLDSPLIPPNIVVPSWDDCAQELVQLYASVLGRPACAS